jgi:hypothetical protein
MNDREHALGRGRLFAYGFLTLSLADLPIALWLVSIWPIWNFPITPERQAEVRAAIGRVGAAS